MYRHIPPIFPSVKEPGTQAHIRSIFFPSFSAQDICCPLRPNPVGLDKKKKIWALERRKRVF
jgi:hypothetical protein